MGTCLTSNASHYSHINENIGQRMKEDERMQREQRANIFILLGTQYSGKTTIFQNLQILRNGSLIESNDKYLKSIRQECVSTIIYLLNIINDNSCIKLLKSLSLDNSDDLNQIAKLISNIWIKYNAFHKLLTHSYAYKGAFGINENIQYFIDNIHRIMSNKIDKEQSSILNNEDIIRFHCQWNNNTPKNVAKYSYNYEWRENHFEIIDFDIPIKKIHYLSEYSPARQALLYVTALSSYCETLKDTNINALQHSIDYFEMLCHIKWFRRAEFVLFLNKDDIFRKRLQNGISLNVCFGDKWDGSDFPDYEYNNNIETVIASWMRIIEIEIGYFVPNEIRNLLNIFCRKEVEHIVEEEGELFFDMCYKQSIKFIQDEFIHRNKLQNRVIFCHVTTAIDKDCTEKVFWDVQNILIRCGLRRGGLMC